MSVVDDEQKQNEITDEDRRAFRAGLSSVETDGEELPYLAAMVSSMDIHTSDHPMSVGIHFRDDEVLLNPDLEADDDFETFEECGRFAVVLTIERAIYEAMDEDVLDFEHDELGNTYHQPLHQGIALKLARADGLDVDVPIESRIEAVDELIRSVGRVDEADEDDEEDVRLETGPTELADVEQFRQDRQVIIDDLLNRLEDGLDVDSVRPEFKVAMENLLDRYGSDLQND